MNLALHFARISSKKQEEGYSLDAQENLGEEYAHRNNLKIVKRWRVTESAWKEKRDSFSEMIDYAKRHDEVKHIIFDIADRMTRNDMDKIRIYTLIKLHDKTIHFARSNKVINKYSGSEDEFMLDIEVAVAKKMSNDISRKTKMGLSEKAEQGLYPSNAPLGYKNNKLTHLIDVDETKAPYIKRAFSLMASGSYSEGMLCNLLYKDGFRGRKGNRVGKSALDHLLKNPFYYGTFRWKGKRYQGSHTALISKELFDKVQAVLSGHFRPHQQTKNFYFNNLIQCGVCGCKILGEQKKHRYKYYHCTFSKGRHNEIGYIREEQLAEMFVQPIKDATIPDDVAKWLKEGLREGNKNALHLQENRLNSLQNQHDRVNTRLNRLYDSKFDGEISEEMFRVKEEEYRNQLIEIKLQISSTRKINSNAFEYGNKTLELSNRLYPLYLKANLEEKAKLLRLVASNYTINDATLYPTYRRPFSLFAKRAFCPNKLPRQGSNFGHSGHP
jgi:DNA invertase Pin-like site-specific DNA recombinase